MTAPLLVQLSVSDVDSDKLQDKLESNIENYVEFGMRKLRPVHCTLAYHKDFTNFEEVVQKNFLLYSDKEIEITIYGYARDLHCIALLVSIPANIPYFPADKNLHITMRLNGRPPVYSNQLITRLKEGRHSASNDVLAKQKSETQEGIEMFREPIRVTSRLTIHYQRELRKDG